MKIKRGTTINAKQYKNPLELIEEKININRLLESIYLDEDNLIQAAIDQPKLQFSAGRFRIQTMHHRVKLETELDYHKARIARKLRRIRVPSGRKEFTEGAIKERVELTPKIQRLRKKLDEATAIEELAKSISEVYRTRSDSLRIIVNAGKISIHAKELEMLSHDKKLRRAVVKIRDRWLNQQME